LNPVLNGNLDRNTKDDLDGCRDLIHNHLLNARPSRTEPIALLWIDDRQHTHLGLADVIVDFSAERIGQKIHGDGAKKCYCCPFDKVPVDILGDWRPESSSVVCLRTLRLGFAGTAHVDTGVGSLRRTKQGATVERVVIAVSTSNKGNIFINFDCKMSPANLHRLAPEGLANGSTLYGLERKKIKMTGAIPLYKEKPEVKVMSKDRLLWSSATPAKRNTSIPLHSKPGEQRFEESRTTRTTSDGALIHFPLLFQAASDASSLFRFDSN
jgi:hypothetical protein